MVRYLTFREPRRAEAQDFCSAKMMDKMTVGGKEF
jgi:hypothetical protein